MGETRPELVAHTHPTHPVWLGSVVQQSLIFPALLFTLSSCVRTSEVGGTQVSASLQVFNVKTAPFLARGDGLSDDREAIQKAINAARDAGGGEVLLPAGTYRVTLAPTVAGETALKRAFTVYPNITVRGESRNSSILKLAGGQGSYGSLLAGKTFGADASGFSLRSLTVDHNTRGNPVDTLEDVKLNDANFARSNIRAAVWLATGTKMSVQDCTFRDIVAVWTVFLAGEADRVGGVTVANNRFEGVRGGALDFDASLVYLENNGVLSRVSNNTFASVNGGKAGSLGLRTAIEVHGDNILVEGNTVSGFLTGLNLGSGWPARANIVRGNRFENVQSGIVLWADAAKLSPPPQVALKDITLEQNTITLDVGGWQGVPLGKNATYAGIILEQQGALDRQLENIVVRGNDIRFINIAGAGHEDGDRYSAGIHYNRAFKSSDNKLSTGLKILNNTVTDPPGMGIYLNAPLLGAEISGNRVVNPGSSLGAQRWSGWQTGIFLQDRLENVTVSNNRFSGSSIKQGIYAINTVVGENLASGNVVSGSSAPAFVRGSDEGTGQWTVK